jgi:HK97 family phage major capsid protein
MGYKNSTGDFETFTQFLANVRQACFGGPRDPRLKTAGHMGEADDAQGGFLVPEKWADGIYAIALENAIVRPRAVVLQTNTDSLKIRRLVESSRASSYFGGITFAWGYEAKDKTTVNTKPAAGILELTPHKLIGSTFVSNELEADYENFGTYIQQTFGRALGFEEDYHFIWGNGVNQPLGVVPAPAAIQHARTNNAGTPVIADLAEMAERLLPGSWATAVWLMHPEVIGGLSQDATVGSNTGGILDLASMTCMGRPIILTEKCAGTGAIGDVILADFKHYIIADRSLEISASREVPGSYGFLTDETFWRVVLRVDGHPVMDAPVTPKLGTDTLSAFVVLTTAS